MTHAHLSLEQGPAHEQSEWEKLAADVLRKSGRLSESDADAEVWTKLSRSTLDGITITPLGTADQVADIGDAARPNRRGAWDVRSLILEPDAKEAAEAALTDLHNGVTSLWVQVGDHGVPASELGVVLKDVLLDIAPVVLDAPTDALAAAEAFAALAEGKQVDPRSNLGLDPIGALVRGIESDRDAMVSGFGIAHKLGIRAFVIDGTAVHDLGASDAQELGYVLAAAVHYLRSFVEAGIDAADAADLFEFRLAATDEQFPTIAKFRAVRRLWARVLELSGVAEDRRGMLLHAVTSRPMMAKYDPWVNMLRTTVAAFGAGVGGADTVTVLPFDAPLGLPDALARRNARNTSALLIEESHLAKVTDPAGGAYAVEKLTDDMAQAGWAEFGRIEAEGDIVDVLPSLKARIEEVALKRDAEVAKRKRPLTGVSEFPNLHEVLPERRPASGHAVRRYGHAFEALRDNPTNSPVFLATMGTVAAHTARATFASNLFAAGGIDVVNNGAHVDVEALISDYQGKQPVVCLVGNDKDYDEWGAAAVAALREAGAQWVIVAGVSSRSTNDLHEVADDSFVMGVDALDFLNRTREKLS